MQFERLNSSPAAQQPIEIEQLLEVLRQAPIGSVLFHVQTQTLSLISSESKRIFNLDPNRSVVWSELCDQIEQSDLKKLHQSMHQSVVNNCEFDIELRSQQARWLSCQGTPIHHGNDITFIHLTFRDITETRTAQEATRESEAKFQLIFDSEPECVKLLDRDGTLLDMNPAGLALVEADDPSEVIGECVYPLVVEEHRDAFIEATRRTFDGHSGTLQFEIVGLKGTRRWMETHNVPLRNSKGEITSALSVTREITQRKIADEALRESEERYRILLENHFDGVAVVSKDGIVYTNDPMCELSGYSRDQLHGQRLEHLFYSPTSNSMKDSLEALISGTQQHPVEYDLIHRNGHSVPIEITTRSILFQGQKSVLTIVRDIRRRLALEEESRHHRNLWARANRVSTVGEMATGLAHELNQPLGAIAMYASAGLESLNSIQASHESHAAIKEILVRLQEQSVRAGTIVDRIRRFVGKDQFNRMQCRIEDSIANVQSLLDVELNQFEISIDTSIPPVLPSVFADPVQIEQVLVNLIHNSLEAMADSNTSPRPISLSVVGRDDQFVEVILRDHGPGLDSDNGDDVFDAFYSTKSEGMGMGLAICRTIIEAHGGQIHVKPHEEKGVICTFTIPTYRESAA